jgi:hypothetical protein
MPPAQIENAAALSRRDTRLSIGIIGVLFFVFGFVTWINAILIPYFKIACELSNLSPTWWLLLFTFPTWSCRCRRRGCSKSTGLKGG